MLPRPQGLVGAAGKVCRGLSGAWELQGRVWGVLKAGKRQPWTSLKGHCHGLRDLLELQERSAAAWVAPGSCREGFGEFWLPGATHAAADLSCSSNKSLKPWQCPFKEVQGSRSPAFKTRQNSQTLPCSSQAPLRPRQTFPAAPTSPWGRGSVLLWRFKAASCQPSKFA